MFLQTQELENLITSVLEANDSRCLDDNTDRTVVTKALVDALLCKAVDNLDAFKAILQSEYMTRRIGYEDESVTSMLDASGMDIQQDQDGQYVVYTNVFQEK